MFVFSVVLMNSPMIVMSYEAAQTGLKLNSDDGQDFGFMQIWY